MREKNSGITLIALIITIIVMLILVAVTINLAVNGGLFGYAGNAAKDTKTAMEDEKELGSGIIDGKTIDQWVNGPNIPTINEYGFYYETPYSVALAENTKGSLVLKENNKIEYYINGVPNKIEYWSLEFVPGNNKITLNSVDCNFSQEGKTITIPGGLMNVITSGQITSDTNFTTTFEEYHDIYYDTIYCSKSNYVDCEGLLFEKNGNIDLANGWYHGNQNIQPFYYNIKYEITTSHLKNLKRDGESTGQFAVSMDGKHIIGSQGSFGEGLAAIIDLEYPWIAPWYANSQGILDGTPEDGDRVIYEKYWYLYSQEGHGYTAILRDSTQTFDSSEVLSSIYGVPVLNKNQ